MNWSGKGEGVRKKKGRPANRLELPLKMARFAGGSHPERKGAQRNWLRRSAVINFPGIRFRKWGGRRLSRGTPNSAVSEDGCVWEEWGSLGIRIKGVGILYVFIFENWEGRKGKVFLGRGKRGGGRSSIGELGLGAPMPKSQTERQQSATSRTLRTGGEILVGGGSSHNLKKINFNKEKEEFFQEGEGGMES